MPLVSIIVPSFNHAQFLQRRFGSIFDQTIQDFELIFLDDASTDNSLEVFKSFANDQRVTCLVNKTNSGNPFTQWNKGFELAAGQYVWIAESDDFAESTFLEEMIEALEKNPTAGLATCRSFKVDELDRNLGIFDVYHWFRDHERWQQGYFNSGISEIENYLALQNTIPNASATLIRRSLINSGLRAPKDMMLAGDWYFWVTLLMQADICHIGKPLNHFRQVHRASQRARTSFGGKEVFESFTVYDYIVKSMKMDDRLKMRAQTGLLRRWFSVATRYRLSLKDHRRIYHLFFVARFRSLLLKIVQVISATLVFLVIPFTLLPGFKQFAIWGRDLITRSSSDSETTS